MVEASKSLNIQKELLTEIALEDMIHDLPMNDERFICEICQLLLYEPVACTDCDQLFCKKCINSWTFKNANCPHCRNRFKEAHLNRYVNKPFN
jgi:hypothetical protein